MIEPLPFAVPDFVAEKRRRDRTGAQHRAGGGGGSGRHRAVPRNPGQRPYQQVTSFDAPVAYADWKAINAQALITGAVSASGDRVSVKFRVFDVFSGQPLGEGLQFAGSAQGWRRMAHKVADQVYSRITGEGGYFDSRVVFVSESGPKDDRAKRLAVMDYDGANVQYLTDSSSIVLAPRFSPDGRPDPVHLVPERLSADLCDGHRLGAVARAGRTARHDDLRAALCARWADGGVLAGTGRQHRHLCDGQRLGRGLRG